MQRFSFFLLITASLLTTNKVWAQDPQFSQYYSAPLYLNPALAGITQQGRAGINYRNQWPSIDANFETFSVYADNNFDEKNSSVGLIFVNDTEGLVGLQSNEIALQYAYQVNVNHKWVFRPAFQLSYTSRNVNFNKLVFGDQIDNNGPTGNPSAEQFNTDWKVNYFDIALGGVVYSARSWIGVSMHHIREPNQSFLGEDSPLPQKLSIHGGYMIPLKSGFNRGQTASGAKRSLSPTFNYRAQGEFNQLDLGLYFTWEPVIFGMWYRGIPLKSPEGGGANNESLIFMFGVTQKKFTIGYSFDYTLSNLGIQSGGAHEISLTYSFKWGDPRKPSRSVRELQCPLPMVF
ncbi:type IX secretion system membrane protein PorP/SprF [Reichenbachiella carrageenanivorans]|uniref:Type IX secretion system membrane protein PorP/SprF n=1 Tax=Reichenbachiella carrageenanivorans TaxID=2979869 RepID=A0ABY6CYK2_9BACT|nr:type IX secretion system membrane protein PorP/SprF [Reichenbachiella carrageenanivorans]UXX77908.1 type IX secretion system membrane protein PorP/SprF [Reichenbachiella carrageenanivorans]